MNPYNFINLLVGQGLIFIRIADQTISLQGNAITKYTVTHILQTLLCRLSIKRPKTTDKERLIG